MKWLKLILLLFLFLQYLGSCNKQSQTKQNIQEKQKISEALYKKVDSIYRSSKDKTKELPIRLNAINRAIEISRKNNLDSRQLRYLSYKSAIYSNADDHKTGIKVAETLLVLAKKLKDTAFQAKTLAKIGRNYYDLDEYSRSFENYFDSKQLYLLIGDSVNASKSLSKMGLIKIEYGDYYGSEKLIVQSLKLLNNKKDTSALSNRYMLLGINANNRLDFESAESWYNMAFEINTKIPEKSNALNSKGVLLTKKGDYNKAIEVLTKGLAMLEKSPDKSVLNLLMMRDNLAYAKGLAGNPTATEEILQIVKEKEAISDLRGQFASHSHLTVLYMAANLPDKAKINAQKTFEIAQRLNTTDAKLNALAYLIDLKNNPAKEARLYKKLHDSVSIAHGNLKNTVDNISFQTDLKEKENLQLKKDKAENQLRLAEENKKNLLLGGGLAIALASLGVFGLFYRRNHKQKKTIENLQKELHHRVKNNLAIINTFIEVTKEEFPQPKFSGKLAELQNRIGSINQVHEQLYSNKDVTRLNLKNYIETLSENVQKSFTKPDICIICNIDHSLKITSDKSFPLGLIINEFLTNSFKYAFAKNEGKIEIALKENGTNYTLKLKDNGKGLPEDFDIKTADTFGIRVMKLLSQQLKGSFNLDGTEGVKLTILFPKL